MEPTHSFKPYKSSEILLLVRTGEYSLKFAFRSLLKGEVDFGFGAELEIEIRLSVKFGNHSKISFNFQLNSKVFNFYQLEKKLLIKYIIY